MRIEAILMMVAIFAVCFGGFIYTIYLSSKED
jgi:hypothetical protein